MRSRLIWIESLACAVLALFLGAAAPSLFPRLDDIFNDGLATLNARGPAPARIVVADIDDDSLTRIGQWPWPRYLVGRLLQNLAEGGPDAIGVDIFFPEPDRSSLSTIRDNYRREFGLDLTFSGIPKGVEDNDAYLAAVLARTRAAVAVFDLFGRSSAAEPCAPPPLSIRRGAELIRPPEAQGVLCNIPMIQASLAASGFINMSLDADGATRHLVLIHRIGDRFYPSLPLATFMLARHLREVSVESTLLGPVLVVGDVRIPIDKGGRVRVRFDAPAGTHRYMPADEILRRGVAEGSLKGSIVILGASATGLNDMHQTAVSSQFSGAEIYAAFLDNLFDNRFYRDPPFADVYRVGATVCAALAVCLLFLRGAPLLVGCGAAVLAVAFPAVAAAGFFAGGIVLPVASPTLTVVVQFAVLAVSLYAMERRQAMRSLRQLVRAKQLTLESMTAVAEGHDELGGAHIKRTQNYVRVLARELRLRGGYPVLTDRYIDLLYYASPLHDVGKVGIPDRILFKKGTLTREEFAVMKEHVRRGWQIIGTILDLDADNGFLRLAAEIAATHHEKWDGSGYPRGLSGEDIPLSGRIMALADVYDALTSVRHYKPAFPHEQARAIILENRGKHFDPAVVDAFLASEAEFQRIQERYTTAAARPTDSEAVAAPL